MACERPWLRDGLPRRSARRIPSAPPWLGMRIGQRLHDRDSWVISERQPRDHEDGGGTILRGQRGVFTVVASNEWPPPAGSWAGVSQPRCSRRVARRAAEPKLWLATALQTAAARRISPRSSVTLRSSCAGSWPAVRPRSTSSSATSPRRLPRWRSATSSPPSPLGGCGLWLAAYTSAPQPTLPSLFGSYTLWQFTNGTVPTPLDTAGVAVDRDRFAGNRVCREELTACWPFRGTGKLSRGTRLERPEPSAER